MGFEFVNDLVAHTWGAPLMLPPGKQEATRKVGDILRRRPSWW